MAMNNSANLVKYPSSLHPTKPSFPHEPLHSTDKLDFPHIGKHDPKLSMDGFNDLFAGNMPPNLSMNPLMDRNNPNPDFFLNPNQNPNMPLDPSLLYGFPGFPNVNPQSQTNPNSSMPDSNQMYAQNRNMMFPGGMPGQPSYEDLMKSSNPADHLYLNQLGFNDKNLLGSNMLAENMGFLDKNNQFLFPGLEQELAQSGQLPFQNPLLLNNLYGGGEFNLQNWFMPNFGFEDFYNLQMQGGMPNPNMPGFGGMPGQNAPGNMGGMPGASGFPQGNPGAGQQGANAQNAGAGRPSAKFEANMGGKPSGDPQANWGNMNPQGAQNQSVGQPNFGGFAGLKVEGNAQYQRAQANMKQQGMNQTSPAPNMMGNPNNPAAQKNANPNANRTAPNMKPQAQMPLNKTMSQDVNSQMTATMNHPIKPLAASKSEPPHQLQMQKPSAYAPTNVKAQESSMQHQIAKSQQENVPQRSFSMMPEGLMMPPELAKMAQSGPAAMMKANSVMNPSDFEKAFFGIDPSMMMGKTMKDNGLNPMDPFGLNNDLFLGPQMDVYNKLKEKNKYERSLKIERYKNKKRNWQKKVAYECRRRVANTRLRIKGRFISKKDCEKIYEFVGEQGEAFNDKKNLNLDYITSKLNVYGEEEDNSSIIAKKFNISKNHILNKIDDIINNKKHSLSATNLTSFNIMKEKVGSLLRQSKKIFKLEKRPSSRPLKATREENSESNSGESADKIDNSDRKLLEQSAQEQNFTMENNFEFQPQMQPGAETEEASMEYNQPFMGMNQQTLERMIAQDERLANIPKEALEAMMYNMMQMSHGMGMPPNINMGVGSSGR